MITQLSRSGLYALTLCLGLVLAACDSKEQEKSIVVTPFFSANTIDSEYLEGLSHLSTQVANELSANSHWQVLESQQLASLNDERKRDHDKPKPSDTITEATYISTTDIAYGRDEATEGVIASNTQVATISTITPAEVTADTLKQYPSANYILLGEITHYEIQDGRVNRAGAAQLARKERILNATVQIRVVDVKTRQWLSASTVHIRTTLNSKATLNQQASEAVAAISKELAAYTQLAIVRQFQVASVSTDAGQTQLGIDHGTLSGIRKGMRFQTIGVDSAKRGALIEITEAYPEMAVAKVISGNPIVGHIVIAKPVNEEQKSVSTNTALRIAMGGFYNYGKQQQEFDNGLLIRSLEQQLKVELSQYGGLRIVEDSAAVVQQFVAGKILTDMSQGQAPRFPLDKLVGLDYLLFGTIEHAAIQRGSQRTEQLFGTTITSSSPHKVQYDVTVYLVDASTGEYALSSRITFDQELDEADSKIRLVKRSVAVLSQRIMANLMLKIRPLSVLAVRGEYVVLNHKQALGLKKGDRFLMMTAGEAFVDKYTNSSLGAVGGLPVGELEISYFDAQGWAIAKLLSGSEPVAGALLQAVEVEPEPEQQLRKLGW